MSDTGEPRPVEALGSKTARDALAARGLALGSHPPGTALATLADLIRETAANVDGIQGRLHVRALLARNDLQKIVSGRDEPLRYTEGALRTAGAGIDELVASRAEGIHLLRMLTTSYADLNGAPAPRPAPGPPRMPPPLPAPRRGGR